MIRVSVGITVLAVALFHSAAHAANLTVSKAWVRAAVSGQQVSGAYMDLRVKRAAKLVKIESAVADAVEIHRMTMNDGVMEMRELETIDLPANQTVRLHPGDYHLMLIDLKKPLKPGERVPLKLTLLNANGRSEVVSILVPVARALR